MVLDLLDNAPLYRCLGPRFAQALDFLRALDPSSPPGRRDLDGGRVYAMLQGYETKPAEGKKFEAHRRYVDIQYVVSGAERIGHAHTAGLRVVQPYDPETDCALYDPPAGTGTDLVLCAGAFAIFWPHDAHRPGCALGAPAPVRKVVLKVEL